MLNGLKRAGIACLGVLIVARVPWAKEIPMVPLWELGVGIGGLYAPYYRGAKEGRVYAAPFPYLRYRGEFLRIDQSQVRGILWSSERVDLDISVAAAPPVDSEDSGTRAGMPDLDPVLEVGPSLEILLAGNRLTRAWFLKLPWRKVIATDLQSFEDVGWTFSPFLEYENKRLGPTRDWQFSVSVGPIFGSRNLHDYYYSVAPEFATPERPVYSADEGYSGSRITFTLDRDFGRLWIGALLRYDNLSAAAFEDSPLVETQHSVIAGVVFAWVFSKSKTLVPDID